MVNFPFGYKYVIPKGLSMTDFNLKSPHPLSRTGQNIYSQAGNKDHKFRRDGIFKFNDWRSASWYYPIFSRPNLRSKMSKLHCANKFAPTVGNNNFWNWSRWAKLVPDLNREPGTKCTDEFEPWGLEISNGQFWDLPSNDLNKIKTM